MYNTSRSEQDSVSQQGYTQKLSQKSQRQERSSEEEAMSKEISSVETSSLNKVFTLLCSATTDTESSQLDQSMTSKDGQQTQQNKKKIKEYFTYRDVTKILNDLDYYCNKIEIEQMIWEVNDSLNGKISRYEFDLMYKRCCSDPTGLEPRNLYNVVQFLMYLQNNNDQEERKNKTTITVEDTLELLYVRHGRQQLDQEIDEIFGEQKKTQDGQEKELTIAEYLTTIKKKDFRDRETKQKERTTVQAPTDSMMM